MKRKKKCTEIVLRLGNVAFFVKRRLNYEIGKLQTTKTKM